MIDPFAQLPTITFANTDVAALETAVVTAFQSATLADTGENLVLTTADRRYHLLLSLCAYIIQERELIDSSAKQNLLPFAQGGFLDYLATIYGQRAYRLPASSATTTLAFTIPAPVGTNSVIPSGTLVSSSSVSGLLFSTNSNLTIPAGLVSGTVSATATTAGVIGNGLGVGDLITLSGYSGFAVTVRNTQITVGGADVETDYNYARRIFIVTDSFSNAGSYGAYKFFALSASSSIASVSVIGPESGLITPGNVLIVPLLANGVLPNSALLAAVLAEVNPDTIRDLCAHVTVSAPTKVAYTVIVKWWAYASQANSIATITANVQAAGAAWIANNMTLLGGPVNPSTLEVAMVNAGAASVEVDSPLLITMNGSQVPAITDDPIYNFQGYL